MLSPSFRRDGGDVASVECCVCMADSSDENIRVLYNLQDDGSETLLGLNAIDDNEIEIIKGGRSSGAPQVIFASICGDGGEHAICNYCLHHLATSFGTNHPVGPRHPLIPCPYPFKTCLTPTTGLPNYFSHTSIERLLTDEEIPRYRAHVMRYQFPGFELMPCPRPSRYGTMCGAGILVSLEDIRTAEPGKLIVTCDQAPRCQRKSCYHCHSLVHRSHDYCDYCVTSVENTNPKLLNHYFYRPNKVVGDGQLGLLLNEEVTLEIALSQLRAMVETERLEVLCTECHTCMLKSELCNTLEHCGIERCYSCGRSGTRTRKLGDHWDSTGIKGCPRFDHSLYWNVIAGCKFQCVEGECYNEELGDCTLTEHTSGINAMVEARKRAHIYHAVKSLLPALRQAVLDTLWKDAKMRPYLPEWWSSDYRTYFPDTVFQTAQQAQRILENGENSSDGSDGDQATMELARNIVTKTSALFFTPVEYPPDPVIVTPVVSSPRPKHELLFERFKMRYLKRPAKRTTKKKQQQQSSFEPHHHIHLV